uniref:Ubiquitin-like protein ATG12 n=1 Tax=Panagrellus redivivus TaxID=6233 RepID=A0A7E4VZV5_PANRE
MPVEAAAAAPPISPTPAPAVAATKKKINVLVKPAGGDTPILKFKNFSVDEDRTIAWLLLFLRQALELKSEESLYVFINQAFAPNPDHTIGNLHTCFAGSPDAKLVVHYGRTNAWG